MTKHAKYWTASALAAALAFWIACPAFGEKTPEPVEGDPAAALEEARARLDRFLAEIHGVAPLDAAPLDAAPLDNAAEAIDFPALEKLSLEAAEPVPTVEDAYDRFERTGFAPLVPTPTSTIYPYGRSEPVLTCLPTRVCDLRLEPGEEIDGIALGDPQSWQLTELYEGSGALTPHVLLKPSGFDLATNLVIATDRRVYHLELRAPAEDAARAGEPAYDRAVSWWYPDQWAQRRRTEEERRRAAAEARAAAAAPAAASLDPTALNWDYAVEEPRRERRRLAWTPSVVVDDGARTLIRLPAGVQDVPAAFGLLEDGSYRPLNASPLRDGWMVIPTVTGEIHLVVGAGDDRRFVRIVNRSLPGA